MSTLTADVGQIVMMPDPGLRLDAGGIPAFQTMALMDANTEKAAIVGYVWHPTVKTGTIKIRKVHFRCGAVTLNAASAFRVSLQNVSSTAGPPYQPDTSQDQTYDFTTLSATAINTTGNLSADRTVDLSADSLGDANSRLLAVVFEFQTFTAADSVIVQSTNGPPFNTYITGGLGNTGSYALAAAGTPVCYLECDDGTYAFIRGCTVFSAVGTVSVASNGAIRRAGLKFKYPTERTISGGYAFFLLPNGCDGTLVLYDSDGTTVLRSIDVDNDAVASQATARFTEVLFEPVTLAADTFYRWVFVAGTTTSATVYYGDVAAAGVMDGLLVPGQNAHWTQHDGASWTDTTTRRPHSGLGCLSFHDGSGGAGGMIRHPGMSGGLNA